MNSKEKILPPCSYQGGKQRVSKEIVDYIFNTTLINKDTKIIDLCCGSGTVSLEFINRGILPENITMVDMSSWGRFWHDIGLGKFSYDKFLNYIYKIPENKYEIKHFMESLAKEDASIDEVYKYILLQSASFGGKQIWREEEKWFNTSFRDFWQPTENSKRKSPVNPMQPMKDEICRRIKIIIEKCKGINGICANVYDVLEKVPNQNCIIYIDPPYSRTTKYGFSLKLEDFLSDLFDVTLSPIFVSEKEEVQGAESFRLNFSGSKGGISGNKSHGHEEWLNIYR